jgi:hypothetical protein
LERAMDLPGFKSVKQADLIKHRVQTERKPPITIYGASFIFFDAACYLEIMESITIIVGCMFERDTPFNPVMPYSDTA